MAAVVLAALAGCAHAQSADGVRARASGVPDLTFSEAKTLRFYSTFANSVFKPPGDGPFPAIVQFHTCGGIDADRARYWTEAGVERGYVVLVIDSLGPRGIDTLCDTRPVDDKRGVNIFRGVKDAFDAKAHLEKLPFVDRERIFVVGYSWGGMASTLAASRLFTDAFSSTPFRAAAAFYPGCHRFFHRSDIHRPMLVLMGELDNEVDVADCIARFEELKSAGAAVTWRVYPGATHSWDTARYIKRIAYNGRSVEYVPNALVTKESARDLFEFLARH